MGSVRWVHCTGAGVDAWLYPNELSRDILLTRTSESFGPYIAEWALSRALAIRQQLLDLADCQGRHQWAPRDVGYIRGSNAVVVGTGDVGAHVARLFSALGATVHEWRSGKRVLRRRDGRGDHQRSCKGPGAEGRGANVIVHVSAHRRVLKPTVADSILTTRRLLTVTWPRYQLDGRVDAISKVCVTRPATGERDPTSQ